MLYFLLFYRCHLHVNTVINQTAYIAWNVISKRIAMLNLVFLGIFLKFFRFADLKPAMIWILSLRSFNLKLKLKLFLILS